MYFDKRLTELRKKLGEEIYNKYSSAAERGLVVGSSLLGGVPSYLAYTFSGPNERIPATIAIGCLGLLIGGTCGNMLARTIARYKLKRQFPDKAKEIQEYHDLSTDDLHLFLIIHK